MFADLFTQPPRRHLFHKFSDIIMVYKNVTTLLSEKSPIKERVGDQKIQNNMTQV